VLLGRGGTQAESFGRGGGGDPLGCVRGGHRNSRGVIVWGNSYLMFSFMWKGMNALM